MPAGWRGRRALDHEETREEDTRHDRQTPPRTDPDEDGDEHRRQGSAEAEQGVESENRLVDAVEMEGGGERVEGGDHQAEAETQEGRGRQEQAVGQRLRAREELARDEQAHRHQIGEQAGQEDALEAEPPGQPGAQKRCRDGRHHLGQEHGAVLRARQPVVGGAGEDGAGGGERDEGDALDEPGRVDRSGLGPRPQRAPAGCRAQANRSVRCSPTRMAFAMAVSAGLTAPMLGKKLVSTT